MNTETPQVDAGKAPIPWRAYLLVGIIALLIVAAMGYSLYMGDRMTAKYAPFVDAAMEIKLEAALAHLRFEEIVGADREEDIATVWEHLNKSVWYANAMLEGGENTEGTFVPVSDITLRRGIEEVLAKQREFRSIAEQRYAAARGTGIGTAFDQRFDAVFEDFMEQTDHVETRLQELMRADLARFHVTQTTLIGVVVPLALVIVVVLYRFERRRARDFVAVQRARQDAEMKEEDLAITLNSIGDAVIATDAEGRVTRMNPVAAAMTGWTHDEAKGKPLPEVFNIVNAKTRAPAENPVEKVLREGRVVGLANHTALIGRHGTERQIADSGAPIRDRDGKVVGIVLVFRDVTEAYRKEEELKQSELRYRELSERMGSGVAVYQAVDDGADFVFTGFNRACEQIERVSRSDVIGKRLTQMFPGVAAFGLLDVLTRVWRTGESGHHPISLYEDERITGWRENFVYRLPTGEVVVVYDDMTERKRVEEALRSEKLLSEEYINSLPGLFYVFDEERFVRWNRKWEETTGYSGEELSTKYGTDFFEGEDRVLIGERMQKVFRDGFADAEAELVTKDGRRIPYYFTGLRKEFDGKPHLVGLGIDITDRKKAEAERRALEAQLRHSQKMEAIGQLAGGVAHDFNNILTAILGNVELSMRSVQRELGANHKAVRCIEQIEKAAQRASVLTRQLVTFSRRDVIQPEVLNLSRILADLDKMLRRLITEDIALETVTDPELQSVRGDAGQLEQVIVNLVVNAADAMPNGGRLTLETRNVTLDEDCTNKHAEARPGPHVLLVVSDTGHGMDAATRERIFEPFFTTKSVDKGTGLGLATVHGIVKQSGGYIMVYSEPGRGATFKIYLPAVEATPADRTPISQPGTSPRGHETVLLCEDDSPVCKLIAEWLRSAGYTVITAGSGQEGIEAAQAHAGSIDLLITDVIMPDMNGRALSERLCATFPGLPTLFISGYTANVIAHHGVLEEGVEFLEKPFTRQSLLTKIRAVLGKTRSNA